MEGWIGLVSKERRGGGCVVGGEGVGKEGEVKGEGERGGGRWGESHAERDLQR